MDWGGVRRDSGVLLSNFRDRLNPQGGPEMLIKFLVPESETDSEPELDPNWYTGYKHAGPHIGWHTRSHKVNSTFIYHNRTLYILGTSC